MSQIKNEPLSSDCHDKLELPPIKQLTMNVNEDMTLKAIYPRRVSQDKEEKLAMIMNQNLGSSKMLKIKKRTPTSYDTETSFYLKSMFFQTYGTQKKLTKSQRLEVQRKTGLDSRKVTYWFSNHKRRSQEALNIYHDTIRLSDGQVSNYKEFIMWRRSRGLPDHISQAEVAAFRDSNTRNEDNQQ